MPRTHQTSSNLLLALTICFSLGNTGCVELTEFLDALAPDTSDTGAPRDASAGGDEREEEGKRKKKKHKKRRREMKQREQAEKSATPPSMLDVVRRRAEKKRLEKALAMRLRLQALRAEKRKPGPGFVLKKGARAISTL